MIRVLEYNSHSSGKLGYGSIYFEFNIVKLDIAVLARMRDFQERIYGGVEITRRE